VKSGKNVLVASLCAAVVALGALAWYQYRELVILRVQVADNDVAMLKKELADARKTIRDLDNRLAAMRGRRGPGEGENEAADGQGGQQAPARRGGRFGMFASMANNPEFQKLLAIQGKGRITQTYAALFKQLNLTPEQLNQFQQLLSDKQQALMDAMQAARDQGLSPRTDPETYKAAINQAVSQSDTQIQQMLGDAAYQEYQQYQQTLPERNVVNSLQQQLSYTQTPLTDDEASQMIGLLQQTQPQRAGSGTAGTSNGGDAGPSPMSLINGGGTARVTDDSVSQASSILSSAQVSALQQIQQQQQAQQQMQQMMRAQWQGSNGGAGATGGGTAAPAGGTGGGKG
jgi:hypothetical protein